MMNFKNHKSGFSFTEVLLAMAIMALVLTPIFIAQGTLLTTVARVSRNMARIFFAKQFMIHSLFTIPPEKFAITVEQKLDDPETVCTYELKAVPNNSVLAQFPDLLMQTVQVRWPHRGQEQQEMLVSFICKPKLPEKKQEEQKTTAAAKVGA